MLIWRFVLGSRHAIETSFRGRGELGLAGREEQKLVRHTLLVGSGRVGRYRDPPAELSCVGVETHNDNLVRRSLSLSDERKGG